MFQGACVVLSKTGIQVQSAIKELPDVFPEITVHAFVVMPNHLHMLIELGDSAKSLSSIVNYFKGHVTRRTNRGIWQKSFYDHVVRDEKDYLRILKYIEDNPGKWSEDRYYIP